MVADCYVLSIPTHVDTFKCYTFLFVGHSPHTLSHMRRDDCGVFLHIIVERENTPYDDVTSGSSPFMRATCQPWQQNYRQEQ